MNKKYNIGWLVLIIAIIVIGYVFSLLMGKSFEFLLCMWFLVIIERLKDISEALNKANKHLETIEMLNRIEVPQGGIKDKQRASVHDI